MTKHPAFLILAIWAAGLGAAAQFGKISILYDDLVAIYGGSGRVALMVSVVGMVGLIFGTTAGILVQRLGLRSVLLAALVMGAAISALQASMPAYPLMMATRMLEGVSHLAIVVVGPVMIAQAASSRYQGLAMTLWSSFFGLSYAALAVIGPPLATEGPHRLFLAHAGYMLAIALLLWPLLPRVDLPPPPALTLAGLVRQHGLIYVSPRIAAPATGFFFYTILYVAILTLLPPMMGAQRALAAGAMPLVSIAVSLTFGVWMLRRVSAVSLVQAGFAVGLLGSLVMGLGWDIAQVRLGGALVMAAALGIVQGASFASIPQLNAAPSDRSLASGAVAQLGNLGTTTGTPILALLIGSFGVAGVVGFAVPLCLCGIAVNALQAARRRQG